MDKKSHTERIAAESIETIGTMLLRITGCNTLFSSASNELQSKITRILDKETSLKRRPDRSSEERLSRVSLGGSSMVERAAQDLDVAVANINSVIADLRRLSA